MISACNYCRKFELNYGKSKFLFAALIIFLTIQTAYSSTSVDNKTQVLIIGGGTAGVAAGIQSARSGAETIITEPTTWLGGMLTSAGVSATDGNHRLPSGIWEEFRQQLYKHYGSPEKIATGWVSNTQFEPHVGNKIFQQLASAEKNLKLLFNYQFLQVIKQGNKITGAIFLNEKGDKVTINALVVVDATDLGDVLKDAGADYDLGMDASSYSKEIQAPAKNNNIVQDLTFAAILRDYGASADKTIKKPASYDPSLFFCACKEASCDSSKTIVDCKKMLDYGKLPGNKYMINWPNKGNDYYANVVEQSYTARENAYIKAKEHTLNFIYYIQTALGFKNLGIADDEFPTKDQLPLIPYHREGRRLKGLFRFNLNHMIKPYDYLAYRTAISVGDYPVDHHHDKNPEAPEINFPKVPSFGIPLGCLIPEKVEGLIVADKAISVSNLANGSTRLQPVVLLTGQAAGVLAAFAAKQNIAVNKVNIRNVQQELLNAGVFLLPLIDVKPSDKDFKTLQKISVTGILKTTGIPYQWANQTWLYPDSMISKKDAVYGLSEFYGSFSNKKIISLIADDRPLTSENLNLLLKEISWKYKKPAFKGSFLAKEEKITRRTFAVAINQYLNPFNDPIDHEGKLIANKPNTKKQN